MKNLIVANWKMNPASQEEAKELFNEVKKGVKDIKAEVVVCPPFVYVSQLEGITLGAQDVFHKEKGAFTGEVSPHMLKDLGVEYVIIGHSERRKYFSENDELINKKMAAVLEAGLKPIFCVGEAEGEDKSTVLEKQITQGLKGLAAGEFNHITVAYEPVWAIGTGKNCSPDETMQALLLIRKIVTNLYSRETAEKIRIIYGGSVKAENASVYVQEAGAQGLLVGGASLVASEFVEIVKSAGM